MSLKLANRVRILEDQLAAAKATLEWVHRESQHAHRSNIQNVCATALQLIEEATK